MEEVIKMNNESLNNKDEVNVTAVQNYDLKFAEFKESSSGRCRIDIKPPEPIAVTDDEEGADEDMVTASLPRDVPGNIEVFRHNENSIPSNDTYSSGDEPLAEKAKRSRRQ
ncbi:unnamed protein product [Euphydryas editha]|uniref:Uncharacterized protein n=1 Tax=Euphydryas editha TaxID=104508 RepID=A0AAU9UKJ0_EUPED|nr:unnamed protein product [Euphydryas editha]